MNGSKKTKIISLIVTLAFEIFLPRCGASNIPSSTTARRLEKYSKIAIVCSPKEGAQSVYALRILEQAQKMVPSHLEMFLEKVTCVKDASIDLSCSVPVVSFPDKKVYDGIVCLSYGYDNGLIVMDIRMLDNETSKEIWFHQFATRDSDIRSRLNIYGYWIPETLKMHFYMR